MTALVKRFLKTGLRCPRTGKVMAPASPAERAAGDAARKKGPGAETDWTGSILSYDDFR